MARRKMNEDVACARNTESDAWKLPLPLDDQSYPERYIKMRGLSAFPTECERH